MYVPGLTKNLLSLRKLLEDGFKIAKWTFNSAVLIKDTLALKFKIQNGLYVLCVDQGQVNAFTVRKDLPKIVLWHLRLAHLNFGAIKQQQRMELPKASRSTQVTTINLSATRHASWPKPKG